MATDNTKEFVKAMNFLQYRPEDVQFLERLDQLFVAIQSGGTAGVTAFNSRTGSVSLTSNDVTTALTFTPYNSSNPSNYISLTGISSNIIGITYTNGTGVFSLTAGYFIPQSATLSGTNTGDQYGGATATGALQYLRRNAANTAYEFATVTGGSGGDADTLATQLPAYYLSRANHTGTQAWSTITGTPTTLAGYGIMDGGGGGTTTNALSTSTGLEFATGTTFDGSVARTIRLATGAAATNLGFTPYNATNPSNYIALTAISSTATGLTYTNTTGVFSLTSGYFIPQSATLSGTNTGDQYGGVTASGASLYLRRNAGNTAYEFGSVPSGPANTDSLSEGSTNLYFTNARAISSTLTGWTSGAGTVSSSDTVLQALQKINGNQVVDATNITLRVDKESFQNASFGATVTCDNLSRQTPRFKISGINADFNLELGTVKDAAEVYIEMTKADATDRTMGLDNSYTHKVRETIAGVLTTTTITSFILTGASGSIIGASYIANGSTLTWIFDQAATALPSGTSGQLIVYNSSNQGVTVTPSGDVTISNTGVTTIGAGKVTSAMLASSLALTGNPTTPSLTITSAASSNPYLQFNDPDVTLPNLSALSLTPALTSNTVGQMMNWSGTLGGTLFYGFNHATGSAAIPPLAFVGQHGTTTPTVGAVVFDAYKWNGTTSRAALASTEIAYSFRNGGTDKVWILGDGSIGIGASPSYKLDITEALAGVSRISIVNSNTGTTSQVVVQANNATSTVSMGMVSSGFTTASGLAANDSYLQTTAASANLQLRNSGTGDVLMYLNGAERFRFKASGKLGVGVSGPTAFLHLPAGTSAANTAPLQINSGTNESTIRSGLLEFNNAWFVSNSALNRVGLGGKIAVAFADAGNTSTTETDLHTYTTKANTLLVNGADLEAEYGGIFVSSATATRQIKVYFGGTAIFDSGALTISLAASWTMYVTIIRVSATVIRYMISMATEGAALAAYTAVGELTGLTLSNTNILKITGTAASTGAATNDIVLKQAKVSWNPSTDN